MEHIVIIGGGFGGLSFLKKARKSNNKFTLIDKTNHHLFQPLLYQVATAVLSPADITVPIRNLFKDDKFLLQSEFRQKNKNSDHEVNLSQYFSSDENTKGHLFYNLNKNYKNDNFDEVELNIKLEQVSDETYLKAYKIESPIIKNTSNLTNSLNINLIK